MIQTERGPTPSTVIVYAHLELTRGVTVRTKGRVVPLSDYDAICIAFADESILLAEALIEFRKTGDTV